MRGKPQDIHKRIYNLVIRVVTFTKKIPKTQQNLVLITQVVKSVTSMGANDREADVAESRKDFIAKYSIVKKETNETIYWLEVIKDINHSNNIQDEARELISEGLEILKIITTIIINTKRKQ